MADQGVGTGAFAHPAGQVLWQPNILNVTKYIKCEFLSNSKICLVGLTHQPTDGCNERLKELPCNSWFLRKTG